MNNMFDYNDFDIDINAKKHPKLNQKIDWNRYITKSYDDEYKSAVFDYVSGLTSNVNDYLRKGLYDVAKPVTSVLDNAFVTEDMVDVYRTVEWQYMYNKYGMSPFNINDFIRKKFLNEGYMSTAEVMQSPWSEKWFNNELIMHITSSRPYKQIRINDMFTRDEIDCADQNEILLPRNTYMILESYRIITRKEDKRMCNKGNYLLNMNIY